jgi:hypothetical protein
MEELRRWIQGLLLASELLLIVLLCAAGFWGVLASLGDETGARFAHGVTSLIAAGFVLTHILLVTLLARAVLQANMEMAQEESSDREPRSWSAQSHD